MQCFENPWNILYWVSQSTANMHQIHYRYSNLYIHRLNEIIGRRTCYHGISHIETRTLIGDKKKSILSLAAITSLSDGKTLFIVRKYVIDECWATYIFSTADIFISTARLTADIASPEVHRISHDLAGKEDNGEGEYSGELHFVL